MNQTGTRWPIYFLISMLIAMMVGLGTPVNAMVQQPATPTQTSGARLEIHLSAGTPPPGPSPTPAPFPQSSEGTTTVLVMDLSGSMGDPEGSGVLKIEAAKTAANQLLQAIAQINQTAPIHQVGIVSFRDVAQIESPPTIDMTHLQDLVSQMSPDGGTNLGDGLYKALEALSQVSTSRKYIIVLSDGLPGPGLETIDEFLNGPVAQAKAMGVCIHTVGLGAGGEMNAELLRAIAEGSGCGQFYLAAEAFQLRTIYVRLQHETTGERVQEWQGEIHQGEEVTVGTYEVLPNQEALDLTLLWPGSDLIIRPKDPNNVLVDRNYPNATFFDTPASQRVIIRYPTPGHWTLGVFGADVPESVSPFHLVASSRMLAITPTPTPTVTLTPSPTGTRTPTPTTPTPTPPHEPPRKSGWIWLLLLGAIAVVVMSIMIFWARKQRRTPYLQIAVGPYAGHRFVITKTPFYIGRSTTNDLVINDPEISRRHAVILFEHEQYRIQDLNSKAGVIVNGQRVRAQILQPGDVIQIGSTTLRFEE